MNIVHLIPNLDKGGAERICLDICDELGRMGHTVKVFIFENINKYKQVYPNIDIEFVPIKYKLSLVRKNVIEIDLLAKKISEFNPSVIHSHLYLANIVALELQPAKHFIHVHSNIPPLKRMNISALFNPKTAGIYYEQKKVYNAIKKTDVTFLTIAKESFNYITKNLSHLNAKIVLEHNAINLNRFKGGQIQRLDENGTFQIISIARLIDYKGHDLTIDVAEQLKKLKFNFFITIFGKGTERTHLQNLIDEKKLNSCVKLAGLTNHPEKALISSDLYFHPTKYEPFGLVLIEAMASGIPVITTDGQGNRDIITDGVNGLFFSERDPLIIAKAIISIHDNIVLRENLIKNGKEYAQNFGLPSYCAKLIELYSK